MAVPGRGTTTYTHDADGNRTRVQDARGGQVITAYDRDGRRTAVTDADGGKTTYGHDPDGNLVAEVEPRGNEIGATPYDYQTSHTYNANGQRTSTTLPLGNTTTYGYDPDGNQIWVTDPRGNAPGATPTDYRWHYTYDPNGKRTQITDPTGRTVAYGYDPSGNRATRQDGFGSTTYTHDLADRLTKTNYPTPGTDVTRTYDSDSNLTQIQEPAGTTVYTYNRANWQTSSHGPYSNVDYTTFDHAGNATGTTLRSATYASTWRADNQLSTRTHSTATTSLGYTTAGQHDQTVHSSGLTADRALTVAGRPEELTLTPPSSGSAIVNQQIIRNATGRVLQVKDLLTGANSHTYTYDRNGRVVGETYAIAGSAQTATYQYDLADNRVARTDSSGTTTYAYDAAGRLTAITPASATSSTYIYDSNGNRTRRTEGSTTTIYTWSSSRELTSVTTLSPSTTSQITYAYSVGGQLIERRHASAVYEYNYDAGRLEAIYDALGTRRASFTYDGQGRPHTIVVASPLTTPSKYYYVYDEVGRVASIRDATGAIARSFVYDSFSALLESMAGPAWDSRFTISPIQALGGHALYDQESQLYLGFRAPWEPSTVTSLGMFTIGDTPQVLIETPPSDVVGVAVALFDVFATKAGAEGLLDALLLDQVEVVGEAHLAQATTDIDPAIAEVCRASGCNFRPPGGGEGYVDGWDQLNPKEREVCYSPRWAYDCWRTRSTAAEAFEWSDQFYSPAAWPSNHNNEKDAFRHCDWSALMTERASEEFAERMGTAHEEGTENQVQKEMEMDLHNNAWGRHAGVEGDGRGDWWLANECKRYADIEILDWFANERGEEVR